MSCVVVENLTIAYHERIVIQGLSFSLEEEKTLGIVGPIGAGKTSLLLALAGLLPFQGHIKILGHSWREAEKELRPLVGIVFQNPDDQLFMPTVWEDVAFGPNQMGLSEEEVRQRVQSALEAVDCAHLTNSPPHHLSGGEKKSVAIATVLAMEPKLWLFDEPSANLDPYHRRKILDLLRSLCGTKLIASHDLDFLWEVADEVLLLYGGKKVTQGPKEEVLQNGELLHAHKLELPLRFQR